MEKLKKMIQAYESWVAANPETVGDVETTTKWVSYFVAGRISDSNVLSELVYSLSNMLVLYNDRIIDRARSGSVSPGTSTGPISANSDGSCYRLKIMLTTLEYCEVFIEISAKRVFGTKGKWVFIALLQVVKAAGRFFILKHSTQQIITSPTIPSLNRRALFKSQIQDDAIPISGIAGTVENRMAADENNTTLQLRRSGRLVRKVEGAPPMQYRDFKFLIDLNATPTTASQVPQALLNAEYLYIAKPLLHLAAMRLFGQRHWKQYAVALSLDLISIRLYHKHRELMTKEQKLEMSRRCINLVFYLMRSPVYERLTQSRLERLLAFIVGSVPLAKMVVGPLQDYLPHWQQTYFYLWST